MSSREESERASCERELANLLMKYDPRLEPSDATYSARLFLKLAQVGEMNAALLAESTAVEYKKATACLSRLEENGLIEQEWLTETDRRKSGKERALYKILGDPAERLRSWAEEKKRVSDFSHEQQLQTVTGFLRRPEDVIIVETVVSSRKPLSEAQYEQSVAETIGIINEARGSIKIATRDFSWIADALPAIEAVKRARQDVVVQILASWSHLKDDQKKSLLELKRKFPNVAIKALAHPDVFRLTIVDDTKAYVVKRSTSDVKVDIEGAVRVPDPDFVKIILLAYFDSKWRDPENKTVDL